MGRDFHGPFAFKIEIITESRNLAIAGQFARRLWHMMILAILFCMAFTWAGLSISYSYSLSSGPTIIMVAGATYLLVIMGRKFVAMGMRK